MNKRALKKALKQSIPILCSYVFISMAYGMLMAENGYPWYVALLASVIVYTGAFQFVLVSLLGRKPGIGGRDSAADEQPPDLLQPQLCQRFSRHGPQDALYGIHHDR